MRILNEENSTPLNQVYLLLTENEASRLVEELNDLLADPEHSDHGHVFEHKTSRRLTVAVVTQAKLNNPKNRYSQVERDLCQGYWDW